MGPTDRNGSPVLYVGRSARRVWPVEVRWRGGTSGWSLYRSCLQPCRDNGMLRCPAGAHLSFGRSASREGLDESWPSTWPTRRIASTVLSGSSAWHQGPKEIEPVASVRFAVSCLRLPWLSESPSFSERCAGSMWQGEHFDAPGSPTGVGNMWRCFLWLELSRRPSLLLVHPVPCGRIIAGAGRIGSLATLGGDHRNCA